MILYIDTTDREIMNLAVFNDTEIVKDVKISAFREQSEKLLSSIQDILSSANISSTDITGIAVRKGPGTFTPLRIGVATANALAFALRVPVVGVASQDEVVSSFQNITKEQLVVPVVPEYGRPPHIIMKSGPPL